jgi:isochorismate synthase EntC
MDIITKKEQKNNNNYEDLNTLLQIDIAGDGCEIFDYNLPTPHKYIRYNDNSYMLEYVLTGVFWTKDSNNFLNEILLRFNLSMNIKNIATKVVGNKTNAYELKLFSSSSNLDSLRKSTFMPNTEKYEDSIFWGIKLFVEYYMGKNEGFVPYSTVENYAFNHYVDLAKDRSTLKAKCRSIWNYYNDREWQTDRKYIKKNKEEVMKTKLELIEKIHKKRREETEKKIVAAVEYLKALDKKITAKNIMEITKISKNTMTVYKHLWKTI